jgi:hypothetical protein
VEFLGQHGGLVSGLDDDPFVTNPAEWLALDEFAGQPVTQQPGLPGLDGSGRFRLGEQIHAVAKVDPIVVPSWVKWSIHANTDFDLFMFCDIPIVERLHFNRTLTTH